MAREDNLRPGEYKLSQDEAKKGGRNSAKARLRKKKGRELLQALLSLKEVDPKILQEMEDLGIAPREVTQEVALHIQQLRKAIRTGDTMAYSAIIKAAGYEKQEIDLTAVVTRPRVVFEDDGDAI